MKTETRYGSRVRELRQKRGWSQEHLAFLAGLDTRTIQRVESNSTKGGDALMAIASAFDVGIADLGQKFWIAESKPPCGLMIRKGSDFAEAIRRANHLYSYQTLGELRPEVEAVADPLISEIFSDIWAISPEEPELLRTFCQGAQNPLAQLRELGLCIFSIQEKRDVFLKDPDGKPIPWEDCAYGYFVVVPLHAAFHLGGKGSQNFVHRFNDQCDEAIRTILGLLKKPETFGLGATALHLLKAAGGEENLNWCNACFPPDESGTRVGWRYVQETLGIDRDEVLLGRAFSDDLPIIGLA